MESSKCSISVLLNELQKALVWLQVVVKDVVSLLVLVSCALGELRALVVLLLFKSLSSPPVYSMPYYTYGSTANFLFLRAYSAYIYTYIKRMAL